MMIKINFKFDRLLWLTILSVNLTLSGMGCSLFSVQYTDRFSDQPAVTTPSVMGAMVVSITPRETRRPITPAQLKSQDGSVVHSPLFFEDSQEVAFHEDGSFAWSSEDYVQLFVGGGRFLLNTFLFPVSAIDTPPWTDMLSDGRPSRMVMGVELDPVRR